MKSVWRFSRKARSGSDELQGRKRPGVHGHARDARRHGAVHDDVPGTGTHVDDQIGRNGLAQNLLRSAERPGRTGREKGVDGDMKIPMEWLAGKTILTAAEVRKLEPGMHVWRHQCFGKIGEHVFARGKVVVKDGKKMLKFYDADYRPVYREIRAADNIAYTADEE